MNPAVPLPTYHCCEKYPAAVSCWASGSFGHTWCHRRIQTRRMTAPPSPVLSPDSMCAHTLLMTACLLVHHPGLELCDRAPAPQEETLTQDRVGRNISSARVHTGNARVSCFLLTSMHSNSLPRDAGGRVPFIRSGERKGTEWKLREVQGIM